jgi:hypothetical protein
MKRTIASNPNSREDSCFEMLQIRLHASLGIVLRGNLVAFVVSPGARGVVYLLDTVGDRFDLYGVVSKPGHRVKSITIGDHTSKVSGLQTFVDINVEFGPCL